MCLVLLLPLAVGVARVTYHLLIMDELAPCAAESATPLYVVHNTVSCELARLWGSKRCRGVSRKPRLDDPVQSRRSEKRDASVLGREVVSVDEPVGERNLDSVHYDPRHSSLQSAQCLLFEEGRYI